MPPSWARIGSGTWNAASALPPPGSAQGPPTSGSLLRPWSVA